MCSVTRLFWAVCLCLASCAPPAPRFIQVDAPDDTRDGFGTYRVTALMRGATDSVVAIYGPVVEGGLGAGSSDALRSNGEGRYIIDLPGIEPGRTMALQLRAEGPGGEVLWPAEGVHTFRVLDASGVCLVDGDCLSGEMCNRITERCVERTLECENDGDCPLDYECDAERGECRFRRSACEDDVQCGRGRICEDGLCVARPECQSDDECPDGSTCLIPPGRCVGDAECDIDGDCPADRPICLDGACIPQEPCPGGCPPGSDCIGDRCVDNGVCGGECPPGQFCSDVLQACVICTADGHCDGGQICVNNACVAGPRSAACTPCGGDGDCGNGFACDFEFGGICAPLCVRGECPGGLFCQGDLCRSGTFCAGEECFGDFDCEGACMAGICEDPQRCAGDGDCADDRACDEGVCIPRTQFCYSPFDCNRGEICLGGRCEPGQAIGECRPCEVPSDCSSPSLCADIDGSGPRCIPICGPDGCADGSECQDVAGIGLCLPFDGICREGQCGQDVFEGAEPSRLQAGEPLRRFVCSTDVDEILVGRAGTIAVDAGGSIQLTLTDAATGEMIDRARLNSGDRWRTAVTGRELLIVESPSPEDVDYRVLLELEEPGDCDDDVLEDNDEPQRGTVIGDGADIRPTACEGDEDWYRVRAGGPGEILLGIRGQARGTLQWQLFRGDDLNLEGVGDFEEGSQQIRIRDGEQPWFLAVRCVDCPGGIDYTLQTRFGEGEGCAADAFEPNNDLRSASGLDLPTDEPDLVVCEGDDDFFVFTVPARTRQRVDLTFTHGRGDIDTELFRDGQVVEASASGTDNERMDLPVSRREATYVLRVYLFPSTPQNTYRLRIRER
jgi:hypothetical protein